MEGGEEEEGGQARQRATMTNGEAMTMCARTDDGSAVGG